MRTVGGGLTAAASPYTSRTMQPHSFRWVGRIYVPVWLGIVALFVLAFRAGNMSISEALLVAAVYMLPPAVLGVGVVRVCIALPWSSQRRGRFFATHLVMAPVFVAACGSLTFFLFTRLLEFSEEMIAAEGGPQGLFASMCFFALLFYFLLVGFAYAAIGEHRRREQEAAATRAEALRAQAELKALRAQVNPHFLFNTLHSLLALVRKDPRAAEVGLEQFGDLMRYALRAQQEVGDAVPLADEWAFARDYLALEKLRLADRLNVHVDIDEQALACAVPAFSLQPLLENSIAHAIAPRAAAGNVWIRAARQDGRLTLEVRDDGPGADPQEIEDASGTGLRLLRRRLAALHGEAAGLRTARDEGGFAVRIELPAAPAALAGPDAGREIAGDDAAEGSAP